MRINYGQNVSISGLAGGVSLAGAQGGLWAVVGGNWQLADGLIRHANASLSLNHEVVSVTAVDEKYEVGFEGGGAVTCDAVVMAASLDESKILFTPPVNLLQRRMQHTFTTFVRGLLNPVHYNLSTKTLRCPPDAKLPRATRSVRSHKKAPLSRSCCGVKRSGHVHV